MPRVTDKIRTTRMYLAGHIQRHEDITPHELCSGIINMVGVVAGRKARLNINYINRLKQDAGVDAAKT